MRIHPPIVKLWSVTQLLRSARFSNYWLYTCSFISVVLLCKLDVLFPSNYNHSTSSVVKIGRRITFSRTSHVTVFNEIKPLKHHSDRLSCSIIRARALSIPRQTTICKTSVLFGCSFKQVWYSIFSCCWRRKPLIKSLLLSWHTSSISISLVLSIVSVKCFVERCKFITAISRLWYSNVKYSSNFSLFPQIIISTTYFEGSKRSLFDRQFEYCAKICTH